MFEEKKGKDWTLSYDKSPYTHGKLKKCQMTTQNATKNFDYTTIAERLRTVSRSNDSHPFKINVLKFKLYSLKFKD